MYNSVSFCPAVKYLTYGYIFVSVSSFGSVNFYYARHSFAFATVMLKEQEQRASVLTVTINGDSGAAINPSINKLIQSLLPSPTVV